MAPAPQTHVPLALQVSALSGSQVLQVPPVEPQALVECGWHRPSAQQPFGQLADEHGAGPHAPAVHTPLPHETQLVPPEPQSSVLVPGRQVLPEQQPPSQLLLSQVATPQPPS